MDAESILIAAAMLLNWLALLCFAGAAVFAWVLVFPLEVMSGPQGFFLALVGWFIGAVWQEGGFKSSQPETVEAGTRPSIAALAAVMCGLIWGFVSMSSTKSIAIGGVVLFALLLLHERYQAKRKANSGDRSKLVFAAALFGYAAPPVLRAVTQLGA